MHIQVRRLQDWMFDTGACTWHMRRDYSRRPPTPPDQGCVYTLYVMAQQRWRSLACSMSLESIRHAASSRPDSQKRIWGFFGAALGAPRGPVATVPNGKFRKLFRSRLGYWEVKGAYTAEHRGS